jgi:hypothetical protein
MCNVPGKFNIKILAITSMPAVSILTVNPRGSFITASTFIRKSDELVIKEPAFRKLTTINPKRTIRTFDMVAPHP